MRSCGLPSALLCAPHCCRVDDKGCAVMNLGWRLAAAYRQLDFLPRALRDGIATFVEFDVVNESLDRFASQAALVDALGKNEAAFVSPAELRDEPVPNVALFVCP